MLLGSGSGEWSANWCASLPPFWLSSWHSTLPLLAVRIFAQSFKFCQRIIFPDIIQFSLISVEILDGQNWSANGLRMQFAWTMQGIWF